jgi:hypothetical protein
MLATLLILAAITGCAVPTPTVAPAPTLMAIPAVTPTHSPRPAGDGVVNGWAVLAEKDDYSDVEMTDLPVDYINVIQLHQLASSTRRICARRWIGWRTMPTRTTWFSST